jgi:hypothetical protein
MNRTAPHGVPSRRDDGLSDQDRRNLARYLSHLRTYYAIPDDQPVFPARPRTERANTPARRPSTKARNAANHPWRAALSGGGS